MADRNLVTYLEEKSEATGDRNDLSPTGYQIEIDRSAAGQPGILITITNALGEPSTIVVKDGLALFGPVLEWLLLDTQLKEDVARHVGNRFVDDLYDQWSEDQKYRRRLAASEHLHGLVAVAIQRMAADTTDDGSPVQ